MKYLFTLIILFSLSFSYAQNLNWNSLEENEKHITYLNFGYNYGVTSQVGYAYQINSFKPIVLNADYSFPLGINLFDDFKVRIGAQMPVYQYNNIRLTLKVQSVFRNHETKLVRMSNLGSELSAIVGIYKQRWHLALEVGYDNSNFTYLKHFDLMKEIHPDIKDGWYAKTGGNFFYGFQTSRVISTHIEIYLRTGATNARSTDENALLPIYSQLGLIYKFHK